MNKALLDCVVEHIFASFAIIPSEFINFDKTQSLLSKTFLLKEKVKFIDFNDEESQNNVYGCTIECEGQEIKLLLADCSQDSELYEYAMLIQPKDLPAYGLYIVYDKKSFSSEGFMFVTINGDGWMQCNTFLQATFLAAMEQIKDSFSSWNKCENYSSQYNLLLSFIKQVDSSNEEQNER